MSNGIGLLVGIGALVGLGAVAYAATRENERDPAKQYVPVWNGTQWVYAEVRPDGLYPTNIPAPPLGRPQTTTT